eukprot:COSAG01_NODE_5991_length_3913_cov_438.897483_4_plen_150_part_00
MADFLDRLVGSKSLGMKVQNREKFGFEPKELLGTVAQILANLAKCALAAGVEIQSAFGQGASAVRVGYPRKQATETTCGIGFLAANGSAEGLKILRKTYKICEQKCFLPPTTMEGLAVLIQHRESACTGWPVPICFSLMCARAFGCLLR